ncbi:MAG TPA: hypothetical protein PLA80_14025, partial [Synergistaceae bacterium]|nr:hypothetical protein [Synergistaceae bacterium]
GELVRRFGQNERTLFSFLSSGEAHAFPAWLHRAAAQQTEESHVPMLGLCDLYDYFCQRESFSLVSRAENQRWIEIHAIISQFREGREREKNLLKTVGILNLLSDVPGVGAFPELLHAALETEYYGKKEGLEKALQVLLGKNVLLYREYAREYRLWEGSDCDLDGELVKAKGRIALRSMVETLEEMMPRSPLVAARHSYQTGTLREFAVQWCTEDEMEILSRVPKKKQDHDGVLWLLIGRSSAEEILKDLPTREDPSLEIFGYSPSLEQLRQLIIHAAASKELCALPQLQRDGVARREAVYRASRAAKELETFLENLFSPGSPGVAWYVGGEKKDVPHQRALSALLSDLCDGAFHASPRINS